MNLFFNNKSSNTENSPIIKCRHFSRPFPAYFMCGYIIITEDLKQIMIVRTLSSAEDSHLISYSSSYIWGWTYCGKFNFQIPYSNLGIEKVSWNHKEIIKKISTTLYFSRELSCRNQLTRHRLHFLAIVYCCTYFRQSWSGVQFKRVKSFLFHIEPSINLFLATTFGLRFCPYFSYSPR